MKPEEHYQVLFHCWSQQFKPTKHYAYELYCNAIRHMKQVPMKERTARNYLDKIAVEAAAQKLRQHGQTYGDKFAPYIRRKATKYSFSMLTGDGIQFGETVMVPPSHRLHPGRSDKPYLGQLWAFIWYDDASGAVAGWEFGLSESFDMIRSSLRRAVKLHNRVPLSLQADKLVLNNAEMVQLMNRSGLSAQKKKPYNPKEMMAERFHKELGAVHKELSDRWINRTNHTINTMRDGREIGKDASDMKHVDEAITFFVQVINDYNNEVIGSLGNVSRIDICANTYNPAAKEVDDLTRLMMFGIEKEVSISQGAVRLQLQKKKYEWLVPGIAYASGLMAPKMKIVFDIEYPDLTVLYTTDGKYVTDLVQLTDANKPSRSAVECTPSDWEGLQMQQDNKKAFDASLDTIIETSKALVSDMELEANMVKYGQQMRKDRQVTEWAKMYANEQLGYEREPEYVYVEQQTKKHKTRLEMLRGDGQ
jgi:hypothetical protein